MNRSALLSLACAATLVHGHAHADTLHVPADYATIQAAIDASVDGDVVLVADGVYTGPGNRDMDFGGRAITVRSENGPGACIIDIAASEFDPHRAFHFHSGEGPGSAVEGFTITGGFMDRGGAVLCELSSEPVFRGCVFEGNTTWTELAVDRGGAVYTHASSPAFADCTFEGNRAEGHGGAVAFVGSQSGQSTLEFIECRLIDNSSRGGGAVSVWGEPDFEPLLRITSCDFSHNASRSGGAVLSGSHSYTIIEDSTFTSNRAAYGGGALSQGAHARVDIVRSTFDSNQQDAPDGHGGGAIRAADDNSGGLTLVDCVFTNNYSVQGGGAGINPATLVTGCVFIGNSALPWAAGGAWASAGPIANCLFVGNRAYEGGAVTMYGASDIVNCTFSRNEAQQGGAIYSTDRGSVLNSILWEHGVEPIADVGGTLVVAHSNVQGGWPGVGNIDADPLFVDPDNSDFSLSPYSPCIDAADNTAVPEGVLTDLAGNPRFHDDPWTEDTGVPGGAGGNAIVDMGAYEFQGVSCAADFNGDGAADTRDVLAFLNAWNRQDQASDCDGNGTIDTRDVLCFLNLWTAGC